MAEAVKAAPSSAAIEDLAVLMAVLNDADRLGASVRAAAGAQVVVVDLGSSDDSVAVARGAGAEVISGPGLSLCDAYNTALSRVQASWVLVLDVGERLVSGGRDVLEAAMSSGGFDCGMLPCVTAAGLRGLVEPVWEPRLFRRAADLHWSESPRARPRAWLSAPGRVVRDLNGTILRDGERGSALSAHGLRHLQALAAQHPEDGLVQVELARAWLHVGDATAAWAAQESAWALAAADAGQRTSLATLATLRASALLQRGDAQAAMQTLSSAAGWGARHPNMFFLQGVALERLAAALPAPHSAMALRKASEVLSMCSGFRGQRFTEGVLPGATGWAADLRRAVCLLALGEPDAARPLLSDVCAVRPELEEARLGLAESLLEVDPSGALETLSGVCETAGVDGWLLSAAAHEVRGDLPAMAQALVQALPHLRDGFRGPWRRPLLDDLVSLLGILQGDPRPGRTALGALAGLISGYPPGPEESYPASPGSATARRLGIALRYLADNGEHALLGALREPAAERLFPGLSVLLAESVGGGYSDSHERD